MICVFHKSDYDGICSAAITRKFFIECYNVNVKHPEDVICIGVTHGEDINIPSPDILKKHTVVFVDFSFDVDKMKQISESCKELIVIDHHISMINDYQKENFFPSGIMKTEEAACELTWKYFFPHLDMPRAVKLLGRFDVWDHSDKNTIPFQYGMKSYNVKLHSQIWDDFLNDNNDSKIFIEDIITAGKHISKFLTTIYDDLGSNTWFKSSLDNVSCLCANNPMPGSFKFLGNASDHNVDMLISFNWNSDIGKWSISLYSDVIDVSEIAKKYGGGGHKGASGFQAIDLPFELCKKEEK